MRTTLPFLPHPDANWFREMCWGRGSACAVLVVERDHETTIIGGIWRWICSRAVHQDYLSHESPATLGCRNDECPLFPPA